MQSELSREGQLRPLSSTYVVIATFRGFYMVAHLHELELRERTATWRAASRRIAGTPAGTCVVERRPANRVVSTTKDARRILLIDESIRLVLRKKSSRSR